MRIDSDTEIADRLGSIDDQHPDQSQEDWELLMTGTQESMASAETSARFPPPVAKPPELIRVDLVPSGDPAENRR